MPHYVVPIYIEKTYGRNQWVGVARCVCDNWQDHTVSNESRLRAARNLYHLWYMKHGRYVAIETHANNQREFNKV